MDIINVFTLIIYSDRSKKGLNTATICSGLRYFFKNHRAPLLYPHIFKCLMKDSSRIKGKHDRFTVRRQLHKWLPEMHEICQLKLRIKIILQLFSAITTQSIIKNITMQNSKEYKPRHDLLRSTISPRDHWKQCASLC